MVWNRTKKKKAADALAKKTGKKPRGTRRKLDNYETPPRNTFQLPHAIKFKGPIFEPACGSGRMAKALRESTGLKVIATDLSQGPQFDFLKRTKRWPGDIVTNPPYGAGLADAFVNKALELAGGRVAMLVELKYLTGDKRATNVFIKYPPELVIIIPERIYFFAGKKPITAQFYNHCWIVWPPRRIREMVSTGRWNAPETKMIWADPKAKF